MEEMLAFVARSEAWPAEVRVNFGFAGREATAAEIDDLARMLLPVLGHASIIKEERREITEHSAVAVQQVCIEVPQQDDQLARQVAAIAEEWAQSCIAERHAEVSDL
jgi:hypothetical protein